VAQVIICLKRCQTTAIFITEFAVCKTDPWYLDSKIVALGLWVSSNRPISSFPASLSHEVWTFLSSGCWKAAQAPGSSEVSKL